MEGCRNLMDFSPFFLPLGEEKGEEEGQDGSSGEPLGGREQK